MARNSSQPNPGTSQLPGKRAGSPGAKSHRRRLYLAVGLAALVLLVASTATGAATKVYSIVSGDTLNDIAADHGTDVATLVSLNGIEDPDLIIAGDGLEVPDGDLTSYTVRDGDTLAEIAETYSVEVRELVAVNKLENADVIFPGQVLLIYQPVEGEASATDETREQEAAGDESEAEEPTADPASVDSSEEATEEEPTDEAVDESESDTEETATEDAGDSPGSQSGRLHLVRQGETLADIATEYGVTEAQLIAANALGSSEISVGMILKVPFDASSGVELIGMPAATEPWPLMSELAATSIATAYWGAPVSANDLLAQLERSENPHLGFRGNPQGMFGTTDDYGVYATPLAEALTSLGFTAEAFYADGDSTALTSRIDAGTPVVVWVTFDLAPQERIVVESDLGRYSLVAEQHAVVVYGYDDDGVKVIDVSTGAGTEWAWDDFMASWSLFDGMGLAIDLE